MWVIWRLFEGHLVGKVGLKAGKITKTTFRRGGVLKIICPRDREIHILSMKNEKKKLKLRFWRKWFSFWDLFSKISRFLQIFRFLYFFQNHRDFSDFQFFSKNFKIFSDFQNFRFVFYISDFLEISRFFQNSDVLYVC